MEPAVAVQIIEAATAPSGEGGEEAGPLIRLLRRYRDFISGVLAAALGLTVDDHFLVRARTRYTACM